MHDLQTGGNWSEPRAATMFWLILLSRKITLQEIRVFFAIPKKQHGKRPWTRKILGNGELTWKMLSVSLENGHINNHIMLSTLGLSFSSALYAEAYRWNILETRGKVPTFHIENTTTRYNNNFKKPRMVCNRSKRKSTQVY